MKESKSYPELVTERIAVEFGEPAEFVSFNSAIESEGIPKELRVLYYHPVKTDPIEDHISIICTAGLSASPQQEDPVRIEIGYEFYGETPVADRDKIARDFAEIVASPYRNKHTLRVGTIIEGIDLYPFSNMKHAIIADWNILGEVDLFTPDYIILLMRFIPLFSSEVEMLAGKEIINIKVELSNASRKVKFDDPNRDPFV